MNLIYQSPFLIALGWTIAASIWQSALLWLFYQAICSVHRHISPARKHFIASLLLLGSFGWFSITLANKYSEIIKLNEYLSGLNTNAATPAYSPDILFSHNGLTDFANQYLPYISAAYLIVLLLLSVKLINAYLHSKQLKTTGLLPINEHWINLVNKYARKIGIVKKVNIHLSRYISVPATLNFFKPVILLPLAAFNHLTPQQVESVILHELAHIKRNDYLINIMASVIETILFFNPFVHLLGKSLKKEREHCCDDFVLQHRFDPHSYASALLSLEQLRVGMQPLAIAATGRNNYQLLGRIKRIMNVNTTHFNYGQKLLALVLMAFIMISVAWLSPSPQNNTAASRAGDIYNDEAKSNPAGTILPGSEIKTAPVQKTVNDTPGATRSNKNNKTAAPRSGKDQNDFPAPTNGSPLLPLAPHPPASPLTPPPPPSHTGTEDGAAMTILPSPAIGSDIYISNDFADDDARWKAEEWLNALPGLKKQGNSKKISFNDLALFMDASKIKIFQNNQLLNREQWQDLLKQLNEIQVQYENAGIENLQAKRRTVEKKAANGSHKDRAMENRTELLFFDHLKDGIPDIKKMFSEEKLKLDSIRKVSVELAEKQKEIWLEQAKEQNDANERNAIGLYEFIVRVENHVNLHPVASGSLQKNIDVITNTEKELVKNQTERNHSHSGNRSFSFTIAASGKAARQKPVHRSVNTGKNPLRVVSL
ncbi:M56 family metallopeptidase [Agriterribacter sp.]|uniref:M56 family metallopeptidase n=1 Tax=Agriterribacter sp. TaxID=2821509 RepID=UPI002BE62248|nr:M56 family metallopeptidase [Agriterribacter sp.]HRP56891.1 M56 family metallopeptidase [Agriterribacter sp.]